MWPHRGMARFESRYLLLNAVGQASHEKLTHAIPLGAISKPLAVGRGLRVVMQCAGRRVRQLLGLSVHCDLEQFHALTHLGGIEDRAPVAGPDRRIAAPAAGI